MHVSVCVCVCVCVCVSIPPGLIRLPPTCRSAGVWLIWAEVVVTSWTGVDFLSSANTDLVFIISSVSCLYVFIDQRYYWWWYEDRGDGSGSERGKRNDRKSSLKLETVLLFLSVFASCTHKSAGRQSGCSYAGKVPIRWLRLKGFWLKHHFFWVKSCY